MISFIIDTSHSRLIMGIVDEINNKVLAYFDEIIEGDLSAKIFEIMGKCFDESRIMPNLISKLYVGVGPGSFTGVRVGVTIMKTYAWSLEKDIIPISSLEVLASGSKADYVIPMIDARREAVFAGIYDKKLNSVMKDKYITLKDLKAEIGDKKCEYITDDNIEFFGKTSLPKVDILKLINKHKNDEGINPHEVNPEYLKVTEAEANREAKND